VASSRAKPAAPKARRVIWPIGDPPNSRRPMKFGQQMTTRRSHACSGRSSFAALQLNTGAMTALSQPRPGRSHLYARPLCPEGDRQYQDEIPSLRVATPLRKRSTTRAASWRYEKRSRLK
jgi:hypothetical protein